jgi:hypothetical protein
MQGNDTRGSSMAIKEEEEEEEEEGKERGEVRQGVCSDCQKDNKTMGAQRMLTYRK